MTELTTTNEETSLVSMTAADEAEDSLMASVIQLPGYQDTSDKTVLRNVKDVFKAFEVPEPDGASPFQDMNALAQYTLDAMGTIKKVREQADGQQLLRRAASMARFWYLGRTIDTELARGSYGTNAAQKLATAMKRSVPYIYQIRAVSTRLTVTDCYLLGVRGLDTTHLRQLAQVQDDAMRGNILHGFIEAVSDTSDEHKLAQAKKAFIAAINAARNVKALDVTTSDPTDRGSMASQDKPMHAKVLKALNAVARILHTLADDEYVENL